MCNDHPTISRRGLLMAGAGAFAATALGLTPALRTRRSAEARSGGEAGTQGTALAAAPASAAPGRGPSRLRVIPPVRLADTRTRADRAGSAPDGRLRLQVAGSAGVPATATAVAVSLTTLCGSSPGSAAVAPASAAPSSVPDLTTSGATTQLLLVGLTDGAVDLTVAAADATVDLVGWFEPVSSSTWGRVVALDPVRVHDTRAGAAPLRAYETCDVDVTAACPVDATAAFVTLTASGSHRPGTWTAFAGEVPPPSVELSAPAGGARSALTVVPLSRGTFRLQGSAGGHVAVDVVGYVTGPAAPDAADGLFVPTEPFRAFDTRLAGLPIAEGCSREFFAGPDECAALAMSVSTVGADRPGQAVVWAAGERRPGATSLCLGTGERPERSFAVARAGRRGEAIAVSGGTAHVVVDVYGWFTGPRSTSALAVADAQPLGINAVEMEAYADEWLDYGISTDGRPLRAFRHGSGPRHGLLVTGIHGDEHTGTSVLADLVTRDALPGWTLWLVPVANPDARAANTRFVHEVDMNRDFPVGWAPKPAVTPTGCVTTRTGPTPLSLVESQRLAEAIRSGPFGAATVCISHHDNYNWVAPQAGSPPALRQLADAYAAATGLRRPGEGGDVVPTSPGHTKVDGGFETFAHSLGMSTLLVENKAGYVGERACAGTFGVQPLLDDVVAHHAALVGLLTDPRLPG